MDTLFAVLDLALLASTIRLVAPILLAALGGLLSERVGIFNIALDQNDGWPWLTGWKLVEPTA